MLRTRQNHAASYFSVVSVSTTQQRKASERNVVPVRGHLKLLTEFKAILVLLSGN